MGLEAGLTSLVQGLRRSSTGRTTTEGGLDAFGAIFGSAGRPFALGGDGLDSSYFEALTATNVFAANQVVAANHVGLGLGEAGAVSLVGSARELCFFAPNQPVQFVLSRLRAVRACHGVRPHLCPFIEKFTLFHWAHLNTIRILP